MFNYAHDHHHTSGAALHLKQLEQAPLQQHSTARQAGSGRAVAVGYHCVDEEGSRVQVA
jgi:hypothetical protein